MLGRAKMTLPRKVEGTLPRKVVVTLPRKVFCHYFRSGYCIFCNFLLPVFSTAFSEKTNVRLDVHRFDADCLAKGLHRACVLAFVGHLMEIRKLNEEIQYAFLVWQKVNLSK